MSIKHIHPVTRAVDALLCAVAAGLVPCAGMAQVNDAALPAYGAAATPNASAAGTAMYTELGALSGIGNTVLLTRVPVKASTGHVNYQDITIQFDVSATGGLSLTSGYPKFAPSLMLTTDNFRSGTYKDTFGNKFTVQGPGVLAGGRTKWTLAWAVPAGKTGTFDMTWATGPVIGSPFQAVLTSYKISASTYSWGLVGLATSGTAGFPSDFYGFGQNYAIGAWQTGDQLELHLFGVSNTEYKHVFLNRCTSAC